MIAPFKPIIVYPESDGKRMADNTLQWEWITTIKLNLEVIFEDDPNVFVAGDLLWYPVKDEPDICVAPDALVVFGRPKGHRGSYRQWEEDHIPPQVVFEILSPSNTVREMLDKLDFYTEYGVEEYYLFDPETKAISGWVRRGTAFLRIRNIEAGFTSPRLGIRLRIEDDLILHQPNGERFLTFTEVSKAKKKAESRAEAEHNRAEAERQRADAERQRADYLAEEIERLKRLLAGRDADSSD